MNNKSVIIILCTVALIMVGGLIAYNNNPNMFTSEKEIDRRVREKVMESPDVIALNEKLNQLREAARIADQKRKSDPTNESLRIKYIGAALDVDNASKELNELQTKRYWEIYKRDYGQ